ncbi:MAG: SPFH domain-containing protein [Aggregatilineales bacterium]
MDGLAVFAVPIVLFILVVALGVFLANQYHRVPPNQVMVVYGRKQPRLITNGGVFIIPILETYKTLDLTIITIKTEKDEVYTVSGVPIQLDWVAQVQIDSEQSTLHTAARAFLDKTREEVKQIIEETLSANFRAIVGQMTVETIHRDRDDFVQRVQDLASDDVAAMGVRVISMGIEEITDEQGYLEAMAAPQIAAVKRDATIAQAEAEREARVKAAAAKQEAEQAELHAEREILQQREALQMREVEVRKRVDIQQAEADQEVQNKRALAVEQQQEAEILVPARAERQATEIRAEGARRKIEIEAEAQAKATRTRAEADAAAVEDRGRADANALEAMKKAQAEGERAQLLAEAEGRREIAAATAAEDAINLRQYIIEQVTRADVEKVQAISEALAGLGGNVRVVQFGNGNGENGAGGNTFMQMLLGIPEVAEMFRTKVEALSGEDFEQTINKVAKMFNVLRDSDGAMSGKVEIQAESPPAPSTTPPPPPTPSVSADK